MRLRDYSFKPRQWPPPKDRRDRNTYLFGFDSDNQPYIVRWEHKEGEEGWVATTLINNKTDGETATPRDYGHETVDKLLQYWADAPCLMQTVKDARKYYDYSEDEDD